MFFRSRRLQERKSTKIAITGMSESSGTTHLAVAIANYYASKERQTVLFVECLPSRGVIGLRTQETLMVKGASGFLHAGVVYVPEILPEQAWEFMTAPYDVILFRAKGWQESMRTILHACGRLIVTVNARPWHYMALQENMKQMIQLEHEIVQGDYCGFGITKAEEKRLETDFHLRCMDIPMIADPLRLDKADLHFLTQFLK